jgi:hypothetical protein
MLRYLTYHDGEKVAWPDLARDIVEQRFADR